MRLDRFRVQHFQSIVDTGEVIADDRLTILVGANESGKSALLKALWHFNGENNFNDADISTLSGIRDALTTNSVSRADVPVVTLFLTLSEDDLIAAGLAGDPAAPRHLKVVKTLDNEYKVTSLDPAPTVAPTGREKLHKLIAELKDKINKIYRGRIKRKFISDSFAWVERSEGENTRENLVLFPEWAHRVWDQLKTGDWIQVTKFAPDPYGRNTRALNAGLAVDVAPILAVLDQLSAALTASPPDAASAARTLQQLTADIPQDHPLRDYLTTETIAELSGSYSPEFASRKRCQPAEGPRGEVGTPHEAPERTLVGRGSIPNI